MGIYGMQRTPLYIVRQQQPHCCHYSNGPMIAGGIGFLAGGILGAIFGRKQQPVMMPQGYPGGGYGGQAGGATQNLTENLNKLYGAKGVNIVQNPDGSYSATDKNGNNIGRGTYEEMQELLGKYNAGGAGDAQGPQENGGVQNPQGTGDTQGSQGTGGAQGSQGTGDTQGSQGTGGAQGSQGTEPGTGTDGNENANNNYTVKPGDNLWNIAKQHLKETNGKAPSNSEIYAETTRLMELNGLKYANNNGLVILHPGQNINFGEAKGATSTEQPAETPAETPAAKPADAKPAEEKPATRAAEEKPASENKDPKLRDTMNKGVIYDESTKTHYQKDKKGNYVAREDVKQINKDGSYYDKDGKLHKLRPTMNQNIFYDESTKTHYERQKDGTYVMRKDIKQANDNGTYYDNKGVLHNADGSVS